MNTSQRKFKRFDELGFCNAFIRTINSTGKTMGKLTCGSHVGKSGFDKLHIQDRYLGFFEDRGDDIYAWYCGDCVKSITENQK